MGKTQEKRKREEQEVGSREAETQLFLPHEERKNGVSTKRTQKNWLVNVHSVDG